MATKTITLSNDFHNTSAMVRPTPIGEGRHCGYHHISRRTAMRLRTQLCGSADCTCGGNFGERGGAYIMVINEDYDGNYIVQLTGTN